MPAPKKGLSAPDLSDTVLSAALPGAPGAPSEPLLPDAFRRAQTRPAEGLPFDPGRPSPFAGGKVKGPARPDGAPKKTIGPRSGHR